MRWPRSPVFLMTGCLAAVLVTPARGADEVSLIKVVSGVKPVRQLFSPRGPRLLAIKTAADAGKYWQGEELAKLTKQVDFEKQHVLVVAWRGSGRDRLEHTVTDRGPGDIRFRYTRGRTRDLRPHFYVYVIRNGVQYGIIGQSNPPQAQPKSPDQSIRIEATGKLNAQIAAIGGETTGLALVAPNATLELDARGDRRLRERATELHGKQVVAVGTLATVRSVERGSRSVLRIESLSPAAPSAPGKSGYLTPDGALLHALVFRDAQFGFVGQSGFILTIEPSGEWSRQPFVNKTIRKADRSGKLTPADLKSLERVLRANDLNSLPAAIGKREGANPHTFQITFGSLKSELILRAGGKLPDVTTASTPLQRFANIATAIQHRAEKQGGR